MHIKDNKTIHVVASAVHVWYRVRQCVQPWRGWHQPIGCWQWSSTLPWQRPHTSSACIWSRASRATWRASASEYLAAAAAARPHYFRSMTRAQLVPDSTGHQRRHCHAADNSTNSPSSSAHHLTHHWQFIGHLLIYSYVDSLRKAAERQTL